MRSDPSRPQLLLALSSLPTTLCLSDKPRALLTCLSVHTTWQRTNKRGVMATTTVVVVAEEKMGTKRSPGENSHSSDPIQRDRWFTPGAGR